MHTYLQQPVCGELTFNLDVTRMTREKCNTQWPWEDADPPLHGKLVMWGVQGRKW